MADDHSGSGSLHDESPLHVRGDSNPGSMISGGMRLVGAVVR